MKEAIKVFLICFACYKLAYFLGHITMGHLTDKFRWDMWFAFMGGAVYILLVSKK